MTFGQRLKLAREGKKFTQKQLGEGLGTNGKNCTKAVVSGWEKDKHMPRADQLALICNKLGVGADYLLFGKVGEAGLLPDVAELAKMFNDLPEPHRNKVIDSTKKNVLYISGLLSDTARDLDEPEPKQEPSPEQDRKLM